MRQPYSLSGRSRADIHSEIRGNAQRCKSPAVDPARSGPPSSQEWVDKRGASPCRLAGAPLAGTWRLRRKPISLVNLMSAPCRHSSHLNSTDFRRSQQRAAGTAPRGRRRSACGAVRPGRRRLAAPCRARAQPAGPHGLSAGRELRKTLRFAGWRRCRGVLECSERVYYWSPFIAFGPPPT